MELMGSALLAWVFLCFIFFMIGVWILQWALRINKIVKELELIRQTLSIGQDAIIDKLESLHGRQALLISK